MSLSANLKVLSGGAAHGKEGLRICHLADVHLGYRRFSRLTKGGFNQREVDVNLAFKEAVDRCISLQPQLLIIAGDLFHTVRPSNSTITFAFREIRRLVEDTRAPLVLVAGNHETPKRSDSGSLLRLFGEIRGVHVSDSSLDKFSFEGLGTSVTCLPHAALASLEPTKVRADDRFQFNVLVAHAQVDRRIVSDFGGVEIPLSALSPHEWDYIALGHVHSRIDVGLNAAYSGSLEHTSSNIWMGAREAKGFLLVELPTGKKTFQSLTSPREIVVLDSIDAAGRDPEVLSALILERLQSVPGGLEGKMVRLEVENLPREIYRQLDHTALRKIRSEALNLTLEVKAPQVSSSGSVMAPGKRPLVKELESFCESRAPTNKEVWELLNTYLQKIEAENESGSSRAS